jgi:hypothetical protein
MSHGMYARCISKRLKRAARLLVGLLPIFREHQIPHFRMELPRGDAIRDAYTDSL